ncbi:hypothetical protein CYY_002135 [Polysphondylium violaceum]|uniref:Leucine carboxyl methyltransferase 1 n=1 Tax=Polysphondylium violaceum TaxID=133409 RepID=A0A8J4Q246_9MYCE|nr:hypothetical protein CYY_002135 [Polysphondylium violaceum]
MNTKQRESIIGTNDDAASCKLSAVNLGYYKDDYVKYFVKKAIKRPPLINRGFFTRIQCIEDLILQFLNTYPQSEAKQIISLGCGFDTYYFREHKNLSKYKITYIEVDYDQVVRNKIKIIQQHHTELQKQQHQTQDRDGSGSGSGSGGASSPLAGIDFSDAAVLQHQLEHLEIKCADYRLGSIDLTNMDTFSIFDADHLNVDFSVPTLFLSECVLVYIPPQCGNNVIQWASTHFKESCFITYEQIKPNDEFGSMMIKNIEMKGCPLLSIQSFPEIKDQKKRYLDLGWNRVEALDLKQVHSYFINRDRVREIERLEIFDEFEEWDLIQSHYCFVLAIKSASQTIIDSYHFEQCLLNKPAPTPATSMKFFS